MSTALRKSRATPVSGAHVTESLVRSEDDEGTRGEVGSRAAEPARPSPPLPPGAKTRGQARSSRRRRGPSEGRRPPGRPPLSGATPPPVGYFTRILLPRSPATIPRSLGRCVSRSTFLCAGGVCPATPVFAVRRPSRMQRSVEEGKNKADDDDGPGLVVNARILLATLAMFLTVVLMLFGLRGRGLFGAATTTTPEPQLNLDIKS
ncbi:hypothetical protein MTO96_022206 [Rhipicephalus appendiculatus]